MNIIAEKTPDEEAAPGMSDTLEEAQLDAAINVSTQEQPEAKPEPPAPKRRGRPAGSRNKPKVIEQPPEPVFIEPEIEEPPPKPPKPKRVTKPRAKAAAPRPTPQYYEQPESQTPLQVAANMLEILRLEQAERQYRKGQLYKSWIQ